MDQMHTPIKSFMPIIKAEINKHSEWLSKSTNIYDICKQSLIFKEKQDIDSIDFILAPSQFIRDCLVNDLDIAHEIISLIPYPIPAWLYNYKTAASSVSSLPLSEKFEEDKLKILFVGEVGIRKGIPYLLKALRKISPHKFEMRIVGSLEIHPHKVQEYSDICTFLGRLDKRGLAEQYQWANLFVFPSLAEGSAGVVNEALAFGLPVITTQSSGSNVRDGIEGRIVTEGSVEELVACIEKYFEQRSLLLNHARNAWNRAKEFTLEKTSQKLSEFFVQRST
jgi:glycosyltransferase involved in cell wall biosynthesis